MPYSHPLLEEHYSRDSSVAILKNLSIFARGIDSAGIFLQGADISCVKRNRAEHANWEFTANEPVENPNAAGIWRYLATLAGTVVLRLGYAPGWSGMSINP